jgi:hypothetical protein
MAPSKDLTIKKDGIQGKKESITCIPLRVLNKWRFALFR